VPDRLAVPPLPGAAKMPLDAARRAFLLAKRAARCTRKTLEHYDYTVGSFVAWLEGEGVTAIGQITAHQIRSYLVGLQERGLKDTTQHAHAGGIKAWLNWLVNEGDLAGSPMEKVDMPRLAKRVPPPFSQEEIQGLLAACDRGSAIGARNHAIVLTLLDTGLRAAEFVSLRVGDVNMRTGLATVMGKGEKQRTVRAGSRARTAIQRLTAYREDLEDGDPLWPRYTQQGYESGPLSVAIRPWTAEHAGSTGTDRRGRALLAPPLPTDICPLDAPGWLRRTARRQSGGGDIPH